MIWILFLGLFLTACQDGSLGDGMPTTALGVPETPFTIKEDSELIGGPAAQGRLGDVLLTNDKIEVIIQKPNKNSGIGSFGGTIIDAYHAQKKEGKDQWGELFPMVNIEWTINYYTYGVPEGMDGANGTPKVLRARGVIDVYDYLDLDWVADAASAMLNQQLAFDDRFDDRREPFQVNEELRDLTPEVITEYRLDPGTNYVRIDTTFTNSSDHPISLPVGDFLVGTGELELLIPGLGFSPPALNQVGDQTPAIIFQAFEGGDVSYGYFYDPKDLGKTTSLSYAGVTGVLLGEEFLKILPVGSNAVPEIKFVIEPQSERTITRYFVVGNDSAGSVLDTGLRILNVSTATVSGQVLQAGGSPVEGAIVAVKKQGGGTVVTYKTDPFGKFSGLLPRGNDETGKLFGNGKYEIWVEKRGYHENGSVRAGYCSPAQVDLTGVSGAEVICTLGQTGLVELSGVIDADTGLKIPARLTILGEDPSPETKGAGTFSDIEIFNRPAGIADVLLINAKGGIGLTTKKFFELEPGDYRFVFSHGLEYSVVEKEVNVSAGGATAVEAITLERVVETPGFVSADFHIHALPSPDSHFSVEKRALAAFADGLDVLQSSDHDFLTDYGPVVQSLVSQGLVPLDSIQTIVGDEITPNHYGHLHAFPLVPDLEDPDHGALDWSSHSLDEISPAPDYVMSPAEIVEEVLKDPGEEVIQVNHIADSPTGLPVASGWLTTPIYKNDFGVDPFVAFADPIERRLSVAGNKPASLIFDSFTAVELAIGPHMKEDFIWESAVPTWFNLLNLGLMPTATGSSDSHHEIAMPLGMPRNYVALDVDPKDGLGESFTQIDEEMYAHNINNRRVVVSAGPFIVAKALNPEGHMARVGEIIEGKQIELDILVEAPEWAWFDTIEIYMNTEPVPAEDTGRFAMRGEASSPSEFAKPYHIPRYVYSAEEIFKLSDGSLRDWSQENGRIQARLKLGITVDKDTWVVVVARGTPQTEGYRSLFPMVPDVMKEDETPVDVSAWALTNPIFIDVDGDVDGDGFPFEAKWGTEGFSHLKPFVQ